MPMGLDLEIQHGFGRPAVPSDALASALDETVVPSLKASVAG